MNLHLPRYGMSPPVAVGATGCFRRGCRLVVIVLALSGLLPGFSATGAQAQKTSGETTAVASKISSTTAEEVPADLDEGSQLDKPTAPSVRVLEAGGLPAETAVLILGGQQGGSLLFEALALPVAVDGRIPFWLEIDGTDLLAEQTDTTLLLEIYAYALNDEGGVEDALLKVITFDLERVGEPIARSGVKVAGTLKLDDGEHSIRILVRNRDTQSVGLRILSLEVGATSPRSISLATPLLDDPVDSWLQVDLRPPGEATTVWNDADAKEAGTALPSARPVVVAGRDIEFTLLVAGLPRDAQLVLDVMRFDSTPVTRIPIQSGPPSPTSSSGWSRSRATFSSDDLGPGDYFFRLLREGGEDLWSTPLPVHVLVRPYDHEVVWAELTGDTEALSFGDKEDREKQVNDRLAIPADAIRRGFLESLGLLADGRLEASIRALAELETEALGGSGVALDRLRKLETKIVKKLARDDAEILLPVLQLYQGLYEQKYEQRKFLISTHARRMMMALIGLYAELGDSDTAKPVASSFLAALAARLQAAGMPTFSGEIFDRALQLDGENRTSLLCLATSFERRGLYPEAIEYLRRLVTADPEHWEGQLRLALNLQRTHHFDETEPLLRRVVAKSTEDWVTIVAHQELAAAYVEKKRIDEADEILHLGLTKFPDDQKLRLLRAFLLESDHQPAAAREILDWPPAPGTPTPSPRYQYSQLPAGELASDRLELEALARDRLVDLQAALDRLQSGGAS